MSIFLFGGRILFQYFGILTSKVCISVLSPFSQTVCRTYMGFEFHKLEKGGDQVFVWCGKKWQISTLLETPLLNAKRWLLGLTKPPNPAEFELATRRRPLDGAGDNLTWIWIWFRLRKPQQDRNNYQLSIKSVLDHCLLKDTSALVETR